MEDGWLDSWVSGGPPVCVIEGFSGVGKSRLGRLVAEDRGPNARVISATGGVTGADDTLVEIALAFESMGADEMSTRSDGDLAAGLPGALRHDVLLVVDDFDRVLHATTGLPATSFWGRLITSAKQASCPGRLLLITNRALPEGPWQEHVAVRTLQPPNEETAVTLLTKLLQARGREAEIPPEMRGDVVRWLGRNPRALGALVACLTHDPLDELIALAGDAWDLRDEAVSPALLLELQKRFTTRIFERLPAPADLLIKALSIHRRPFVQDAIERVTSNRQGQQELTHNFLLERNRNWFSITPVARQLALGQLTSSPAIKLRSHSWAADHYVRHFKAQGGTVAGPASARNFVEARFHLLHSGRESELGGLAAGYRRSLLRQYGRTSRLPELPDELSLLIATLSAALEGAREDEPLLRFLLARALVARARAQDPYWALREMRLVTRGSTAVEHWLFLLRIVYEVEGTGSLVDTVARAVRRLPVTRLTVIYHRAIDLLMAHGENVPVTTLLNEGMEQCENNRNVSMLYQQGAKHLVRRGRSEDAGSLLLSFIAKYGTTFADSPNLKRVIEHATHIALRMRDVESLMQLREAIHDESELRPQELLIDATAHLCRGDYEKCLQVGVPNFPYIPLVTTRAFAALCAGRPTDAHELGVALEPREPGSAWLMALTSFCVGKIEESALALSVAVGRNVEPEDISALALMIAWRDSEPARWLFPWLPPELTGLSHELTYDNVLAFDADDFRGAAFPRGVPSRGSDEATLEESSSQWQINILNDLSQVRPSTIAIEGDVIMTRDQYNVEQAAAVGPKSRADGVDMRRVVLPYTDSAALLEELTRLRAEMRKMATEPAEDLAVSAIAEAQVAIESGDGAAAQSHLQRAGKWALTTANTIGLRLAVAAIEGSLGI